MCVCVCVVIFKVNREVDLPNQLKLVTCSDLT